MTVAAELAKGSQRIEYILCIEGIGWPADLGTLSTAWQGTVIATGDINGDLATVLGCTVKMGLTPPASFGDSLDPVTLEYSPGGADFEIANVGLWLDDEIHPRQKLEQSGTYYAGALMADLTFDGTTIDIDQDNPGGSVHEYVEGDTAWLGGREAVLLGSKAVQGAGHRYTGSTRGYLGTPQGSWTPSSAWHGQHTFAEDTIVYPWNPFIHNRRVIVYAHVPGEVRANCVRVFTGRLTGYSRADNGATWLLSATALDFPGKRRNRTPLPLMLDSSEGGGVVANTGGGALAAEVRLKTDDSTDDDSRDYAVHYLYRYREVVGGAELPSVDEHTPQAVTGTQDMAAQADRTIYLSQTLIKTDSGAYARLLNGETRLPDANASVYRFVIDKRPLHRFFAIDNVITVEDADKPVAVLLDNILDEVGANRFTVNGQVTRNAIDTALILMTSCDAEFYRGDAAAGGTTTTVNFTAPGWTTDQWAGYALFCVEDENDGEARLITGNDTDTITVDTPFGSATHSGNEYQIRNSIYDVLPIGWGLQVHNSDIDIASFETVRDRYLQGADLGLFILGEDPELDYWELIKDQMLRPYGVFTYPARTTGLLTARYAFALTTDSTFETVVDITDDDLMDGSFGTVNILPRSPVSRIDIYPREKREPGGGKRADHPLSITAADAEITYEVVTPDVLEIEALLNDRDSLGYLAAFHIGRLLGLYSPPYEAPCTITGRHLLSVQAGSVLSVTTTKSGAIDPDDGSDGLSSTPCRVLSSTTRTEVGGEFAVDCTVQMLRAISSARVAPACNLTDVVTAGDPDYFEIDTDAFVDEPSDYGTTDMMLFVVGDLIDHRAKDGSKTGGPYTIESFGDNETATPTSATAARINVEEAIADAFTAGDYVTFAPWSAASTANQELHSHYADATDEELGAGDDPKEYL